MKKIFTPFLFFFSFSGFIYSQTIHNLDTYLGQTQNTSSKKTLLKANAQTSAATETTTLSEQEVQTIQELTSTIQTIIYQYGEMVNIAKERNVACLKADADVSTFLQFTRSENDKEEMLAACREVQLVRFSFYTNADLEQAKLINFNIFKKFPQLKYIVFYVDPSIYKQSSETLQREQIESTLKALTANQIDAGQAKVVYRIPQGG